MQSQRIDRQRLDVVLERLAERAAEPVADNRTKAFAPLSEPLAEPLSEPLAEAGERQAAAEAPDRSIDAALVDFVMPRISEPAIFQHSRSILERLLTDTIPELDGGDELRTLATSLIEDEIGRHQELFERIYDGLET